ncbi:MAG: twin-arginine translocase TatA/TatE family subunit [Planctomycetes bacterium]|nr:twin-arginine translocase TatA/TatE family subunit [Planctomycetota bacterium]
MLGLIGNLSLPELLVVAAGAVLIFGRRLPEVAMRGAAQFMRLRRNLTQAWRDAGIEDELRRVRWDLDREAREVARFDQLSSPAPVPSVPDYTLAPVDPVEPLEREALDHEPGIEGGLDHESSEADEAEVGWADDLSVGPSEEELRAERGKDEPGHFEPPADPDPEGGAPIEDSPADPEHP